MEDGYRLVQRKRFRLQRQFRNNEMKILKLQEKNSRILHEMFRVVDAMDAVWRERRKLEKIS